MCVLFFQAEDGIRDLVRSRGLGDVYKRQLEQHLRDDGGHAERAVHLHRLRTDREQALGRVVPVSYTHLTLPTRDLV